jgi:hypothetical protein
MAYVLMEALRRLGLKQTELARAQSSTIRLKLLKIGALIRITVRRVWVSMASGCPYGELFAQACARLRALPLRCWKKSFYPKRVSNDSTPRPKCVEPAFSHTVNEAPTT